MSLRWLPDAYAYAHPYLSWSAMLGFDLVLGRLFRVEHNLPPRHRLPRGSLMVSNHVRDSDAPLLMRLLLDRHGLRMGGPLPYLVMRGDLYQRGALTNLLHVGPRLWIRLLARVRIRWVFVNLRTFPLSRVREFTWQDTLREVVAGGMGDRAPATIFNARGMRELGECLGARLPARVADIDPLRLGRVRLAWWGLRRLRLDSLESLAPKFRVTVDKQLQWFAQALDAGHPVYLAPEGGVSLDGRFGRIRAGTWRLPRLCTRDVLIVPFAVSYDPFRPGRTRVLVRMGAPSSGLGQNSIRHVKTTVKSSITRLRVVTPSHLLACFLCQRKSPFSDAELAIWLERGKVEVRAAGVLLDDLFDGVPTNRLIARRLHWLRRKKLVGFHHCLWYSRMPADVEPTWSSRAGSVRFMANALIDLVPAFQGGSVP